jgi:RNA polymerase sigma factor (sigma-70 family)
VGIELKRQLDVAGAKQSLHSLRTAAVLSTSAQQRKIDPIDIDPDPQTKVGSKTWRASPFSFRGEAVSISDATGFPVLADEARDLADSRAIVPTRSVVEPGDETLLVRLQSGEMEALGLLFHRFSRLLLGIARRVLQDNNEAEDLVQDVFLFLFYKGKTFDPAKGQARSWLMQVTYHRAYDRRRYLTTRSFYDRTGNQRCISNDDQQRRRLCLAEPPTWTLSHPGRKDRVQDTRQA